ATLRAAKLMERTAVARTTPGTALARARRRLRDEIDELFAKTPQAGGVLRAALMTAAVVIGGLFFRRLDLLNSAGLAALILLIARPLAVRDSSFQLTFLAIGCIAGLAAP